MKSESQIQLQLLIQKYQNLGVLKDLENQIEKKNDKKILYLQNDLYLEKSVYDVMFKKRPDLIKYLVMFTYNSKIIERKFKIRVRYPLVDGIDVGETSEYELDVDVFNNLWYHKLYTTEPDYEGFEECEKIGSGSFFAEVIGNRNSIRDQYLSNVTDAFLLCDNVSNKHKQNILIVESAPSENNKFAGVSQLFGMKFIDSRIEVYDKNSTNSKYHIGSNLVVQYSKEFVPNNQKYDVVMINVGMYSRFDDKLKSILKDTFFFCVYDHSWAHGFRKDLLYKQDEERSRLFSFPLYPNYQYQKLGTCPSCVEMKYFMKAEMSAIDVDFFLKSHNRNCTTGELRQYDERNVKEQCLIVEDIPREISNQAYFLEWDTEMMRVKKKQDKILDITQTHVQDKIVCVSDFFYVTPMVLECSMLIYCVMNNVNYVFGDYKKLGLTIALPKIRLRTEPGKGETLNKSRNVAGKDEIYPSSVGGLSFAIYGDVSGVSFRNLILNTAIDFKLTGIVKNAKESDGVKVYVMGEAFGDIVALRDFQDWFSKKKKLRGLKMKKCMFNKINFQKRDGFIVQK